MDTPAEMEQLSKLQFRHAGTEGERVALQRIYDLVGRERGRVEGFVAHLSPEQVVVIHSGLLLVAGLLGIRWPSIATMLCAIITGSLVAEGNGRMSLIRWPMPKGPSYNLVVDEIPEEPLGTVIIATPLDAPRWRRAQRYIRRPLKAVLAAALVVTALNALNAMANPWGVATVGIYTVALVVLAIAIVFGAVMRRRESSSGSDASGPLVALELHRRFLEEPPAQLRVSTVFTGCSYAYQSGMEAYLDQHLAFLPKPVLVMALDEPGRPPLGAATSEGVLWAQHHRPTGPALVERMQWAGVNVLLVDKSGFTDARPALHRDLRALALCGGSGVATEQSIAYAADLAETVIRSYGADLAGVEGSREALARLIPREAS